MGEDHIGHLRRCKCWRRRTRRFECQEEKQHFVMVLSWAAGVSVQAASAFGWKTSAGLSLARSALVWDSSMAEHSLKPCEDPGSNPGPGLKVNGIECICGTYYSSAYIQRYYKCPSCGHVWDMTPPHPNVAPAPCKLSRADQLNRQEQEYVTKG